MAEERRFPNDNVTAFPERKIDAVEDSHIALLRQLPVSMLLLDADFRVIAASRKWSTLWAPAHAPAAGTLVWDEFEVVPDAWHHEFIECLHSNVAVTGEDNLIGLDGHMRIVQWQASHWQLRGGASGLSLSIVDVTTERAADTAIAAARHKYQEAYRITPAMMHSIDATGAIIDVSDAWLTRFGYARHEIIGRKSTDFLTAESAERAVRDVLPAFFKTGKCVDVPYEFLRRDGRVVNILLSANAEYDAEGNILRSIAVLNEAFS